MELFIAAITLGFLGSFHCIGMCGPIALALPIGQAGFVKKFFLILSYNLGRIITYSVFGFLFGLLGQGFVIGGYQQLLSVVIGSILLVSVLLGPYLPSKYKFSSATFRFFNGIKTVLGKLFMKNTHESLLIIGVLNGLLPCGLVYMGVAGAITSGNGLTGAAFMTLFGLGTVPAMLSLPLLGNFFSLSLRNKIRKTTPLLVGSMSLLLILRGLNLGIPYISPKIEKSDIATCHSSETALRVHAKKIILCTSPNSAHKK